MRVFLRPLLAFFLGLRPDVGGDCDGIVFFKIEIRHTGTRPEFVGVLDPAHHPTRINLSADLQQTRCDLGNVLVAFNEMTAGAADLFEQSLAFDQ